MEEPDAQNYIQAIRQAQKAKVGAPTLTETAVALGRRLGFERVHLVDRLVEALGLEVVPFTSLHYRVAVEAYARYGKGRHPARLNLGDCLSYALARLEGEPLLYTDLKWKPS